jgi:hypothetical protein
MTCPLCNCSEYVFGNQKLVVPVQNVSSQNVGIGSSYYLASVGTRQAGIGTLQPMFVAGNGNVGIGTPVPRSIFSISDDQTNSNLTLNANGLTLNEGENASLTLGPNLLEIKNKEEKISLVICKQCGIMYNINADPEKAKKELMKKREEIEAEKQRLKNNKFRQIMKE